MKGKKLRATLAYPALFEPEPEGGFTVTFPETGIAATYGPNWDAARAQAEDMLEEAILGMIAHGEDVPWPASVPKGGRLRPSIPLPAPNRRQARNLPRNARRGSRGGAASGTTGLATRPGEALVRAARGSA
jgi:predicted RNase H-like HicB family nuclease